MIITRRLFLIGTGAAIAAASLPPVAAETLVTPLTVLDDPQVVRRALRDISFSALGSPKPDSTIPYFPDTIMGLSISRKLGEQPIFQERINSKGIIRWVATPNHELIFLPGQTMYVDWQDVPSGGAQVWMFYREFRADKWYRDISDCRVIDDDGNVTTSRNLCDPREWIDPDAPWPEPEKVSLKDRLKRWFFGEPDPEDSWDES